MEKKKFWYDHCKKPWHMKERKFMGNHKIGRKKTEGDGWAFQVANDEAQWQQINSKMPSLTKKQLEHLYKFFQSPQFLVTLTPSSLAQKGNYLTIAFF